ncbi:M55 family metallopeptidase [bacterium]|nr:M55 family metallopeptidase [candidate division CSSED10-310 bacterium]
MKVYISADIEGVTGVAHWHETEKGKTDYSEFARQMTLEVKAACEGAVHAGCKEIWIKDAHDSARNIQMEQLPHMAKIIRGWSAHPMCMLQELDNSFDAVVMIGYHSAAGSDGNPLAHTMLPDITSMTINNRPASEFLIFSFAAALVDVPVVFISGDAGICKEAKTINKNIHTVGVKQGVGNSVVSIHPGLAIELIKTGVQKSLLDQPRRCLLKLPSRFIVEVTFKDPWRAYRAAFYPGARQISVTTINFEHDNFYEILRMLLFVT